MDAPSLRVGRTARTRVPGCPTIDRWTVPLAGEPVIIRRMDKRRFSQFEERIQALVEGGFTRLFAGRLHPREVALRLAHAMEDGASNGDNPTAPNAYEVHLNPDDCGALLAHQPDVADMLAEHIVSLARESNLRLETAPHVTFVPDEEISLHGVVVTAAHVARPQESTQAMTALESGPRGRGGPMPVAFLVINGSQYVPLDRSVINLGRRRDNAIVLDDPRVSRQHCQIRFRFGQFVLYDLGSKGGTFVNDDRVSECVLKPGDVIALGESKLVYVVEESTTERLSHGGDTQVLMNRPDDGDETP